MAALCNGVKSPFRMALTRAISEKAALGYCAERYGPRRYHLAVESTDRVEDLSLDYGACSLGNAFCQIRAEDK